MDSDSVRSSRFRECCLVSAGLKLALEEALPGSHIYVFTDASAKDHHLLEEILSLVSDKSPHVSR